MSTDIHDEVDRAVIDKLRNDTADAIERVAQVLRAEFKATWGEFQQQTLEFQRKAVAELDQVRTQGEAVLKVDEARYAEHLERERKRLVLGVAAEVLGSLILANGDLAEVGRQHARQSIADASVSLAEYLVGKVGL